MAGHSKWANIQHRKGRQDAKRGKEFTKAAKEIIIAAKSGGDPAGNPRLRAAIAAAKSVNLPKDKIEAAIRKGTGQEAGGDLIEVTYEGYAPGGIAVIIEAATDNRNRTVADIRHILTKNGGSMGETGCVSWMFERTGIILLNKEIYSEDKIMEVTLESGADDFHDEGETWEIHTSIEKFNAVQEFFESSGIQIQSAELSMIPQNTIAIIDKEIARKVVKFLENLEDCDDVQRVYSNIEISEDLDLSL